MNYKKYAILIGLVLTSNVCAAKNTQYINEGIQKQSIARVSNDNKKDDEKFQKELSDFQEIQREGEFLRLRIQNRDLMKQLGIKDRDGIFNNDEAPGKSNIKKLNSMFLISIFKSGRGPKKAKVYIPGEGIKTIKDGDYILSDVRIVNVTDKDVKVKITPGNVIYSISQVGNF